MNGWCCTDYASMTTLFSSRFRKFPAVPIAVYVLFIGIQANAQAQAPLGWQAAKEPTSSVARIISRKDAVAVAGSLELAEADSGERNPKDALIQLGWARLIFPTPSPAVSKIDSITHTATVSDQMPSSDKGVTKVANLIEFSAENEVESISEYPQSQPEMQVSFNSSSQFTVIDSDASNVPEQLPFEPEQLPFEEGEITQTPENVPVTERRAGRIGQLHRAPRQGGSRLIHFSNVFGWPVGQPTRRKRQPVGALLCSATTLGTASRRSIVTRWISTVVG